MSLFFKSENRRVEQVVWRGGGISGREKMWGKGVGG
jgi:hypothetical protein